jgi:penicillin-binding protein 1A
LRKEIQKYLEEYEKETGKDVNLFRDGLKIYVTLDSKMQKYAEEAIKEHLTNLQKGFDAEQRRNPTRPFYFLRKMR